MREETGTEDFDILEMREVAAYVHTATYHGMELAFPVSEEHYKWCMFADEITADRLAASPEYWQLGINKILSLLDEAVDVVFEEKLPKDSPVIAENLYGSE